MFRHREEGASIFRLDRKLLYPLAFLISMPLVAVLRALVLQGLTGRNLVSLLLLVFILLMFLPWLTRSVVVSPRGIRSGTVFGSRTLAWEEVRTVSGVIFQGRSILILAGARRILITDIIGNFRHLVGYATEHASRAVIEENVPPLLAAKGRAGRDALVLWLAAAAMAALMALKLLT